jgi:hypothetical protein
MDAFEARDHLQLVDGILRRADRSLHLPPVTIIAWGLFGTIVNALHQARASGLAVPPDGMLHLPLMLLAVAISVWEARRRSTDRETLTDQYAGVVFCVVFIVLLLVNVTAQHTVVPAKAMALFWSVGLSMALLIVGIQTSRVLLAGGMALLMVSITAPLIPGWFDGMLALGWAVGFVGPGILLALGRPHGRTVSI